jgi:hypothetical protein
MMRPHLSGTGPKSEVFSFHSSEIYYKRFPPLLSVIFITISWAPLPVSTGAARIFGDQPGCWCNCDGVNERNRDVTSTGGRGPIV